MTDPGVGQGSPDGEFRSLRKLAQNKALGEQGGLCFGVNGVSSPESSFTSAGNLAKSPSNWSLKNLCRSIKVPHSRQIL